MPKRSPDLDAMQGLNALERLLAATAQATPGASILVAGHPNGALAVAMQALRPEASVSFWHIDLYWASQARRLARERGMRDLNCYCLPDLAQLAPPPQAPPAPDLILTSALRDDEVGLTLETFWAAHRALAPGGKLLAATDNRRDQWVRSQLERIFGNLTLAARSRAGIVYSVKRKSGPPPKRSGETYRIGEIEVDFGGERRAFFACNGVFSSERLDEGSRALLDVLRLPADCRAILDLGCGWGAMGILAARQCPAARLTLIDSNARAIDMAQRNLARHGLTERAETRLECDAESITGGEAGAYDAVIGNPPYGTNYRVAELFVSVARKALRPGGGVWLVAKNNPRLAKIMQEAFGNHEVLRRRGYDVITAHQR